MIAGQTCTSSTLDFCLANGNVRCAKANENVGCAKKVGKMTLSKCIAIPCYMIMNDCLIPQSLYFILRGAPKKKKTEKKGDNVPLGGGGSPPVPFF